MRLVELHRERVVLRRAVRGIKMTVQLPVAAYLGVAIRLVPPEAGSTGAVAVVLEHPDPALSLELYRATDGSEIVAEWQSWGRTLGRPLLITDADGQSRSVRTCRSHSHRHVNCARRRRSLLHRRRPSLPLRRKTGDMPEAPTVRRDEREIIARN